MQNKFLFIICMLILLGCQNESTKFGKDYNQFRKTYGSLIIHEYMRLTITEIDYEHWRTPESTIKTFNKGFHFGKAIYFYSDTILQEKDVFRNRINDITYKQVNILTNGSLRSVSFNCKYFKVDSRKVHLPITEFIDSFKEYPEYEDTDISIKQADSILLDWGVNIKD